MKKLYELLLYSQKWIQLKVSWVRLTYSKHCICYNISRASRCWICGDWIIIIKFVLSLLCEISVPLFFSFIFIFIYFLFLSFKHIFILFISFTSVFLIVWHHFSLCFFKHQHHSFSLYFAFFHSIFRNINA